MSKKHYVKPTIQVEETEAVLPAVSEPEVTTAPEVEESAPVVVNGVVADCAKLNVRRAPSTNAAVLCEINRGTKVVIDMDKSKPDWYSICTEAGVDGFCMKKYIEISQ